ncbi:HNH endonuclease [Pedobacter sp. SYSU D00535]|uniref:HNH endonuclease n=1 Tax=Pedobacter sp. SYSU D00535 TaxID=2810308 RepID=UPI001A961195|nr:HNH endonuclease [Pedobacter sp. SYSU D00535]
MSPLSTLNKHLTKFTRLNRANTVYGRAPHKPVLLISIIELIEKGLVTENRVYVNTDLVAAFQENWRLLVNTLHQSDFTQPFYYLQSEKVEGQQIWFLQAKLGCQINAHIKSVTRLSEVLEYAYFSETLYLLLTDPVSRNVIKSVLLDTYFPDTKQHYIQSKQKGEGYIHDMESYLLNEPEAEYRTIKIETEEDVFVRGGLFKKLVPKVYDSTCSFTGMRLESTFGHNFIDACHIVPFSISHDDKVNNGIALCPNLHRAFDRGLVSIDNSYRIIVSSHVAENDNHPYSLKQLEGRKMRLPFGSRYYPSLENLDWHRGNIFK